MIAVVTPDEMAAIDAAAPEPVEVLIDRAGGAVARAAIRMLGGTYGRRVVVVAGRGNNGNDGRVAAARLASRGVSVRVLDATSVASPLPACDLVIDAAYGTGLARDYAAPRTSAPVLAVDIASGIDGLTGRARGTPVKATRTVTFAALKPGLLLADGPEACGDIEVVDIGLDVSRARAHVVESADLATLLAPRARDTHKWRAAVWVIAGSPGMAGAARLTCGGAMRAGAGYVRLSVPGGHDEGAPTEVVQVPLSDPFVLPAGEVSRFGAAIIGPGLGRDVGRAGDLGACVRTLACPVVLDGDALTLLGDGMADVVGRREHPTVLTPHDGEFRALFGASPGGDRFAAVRELSRRCNAVVLLKGPTTLVAEPSGSVLACVSGDARLATAGTGDVLAGIIGAFVARGVDAFAAAASAAHAHGLAAQRAPIEGMVASDLLTHLPAVLSSLRAG